MSTGIENPSDTNVSDNNENQNSNDLINYYTPLDKNSHETILNYIRDNNIEVTFKIYDLHSKSSFVKVDGADLAIFKKFPYDYETTTVYCTFMCGGESHFFRSTLTTSSNYYLIKNPEKIYKIQRRAFFRFTVPANLAHSFKIADMPQLTCRLRDISLGGCKIAIATPAELDLPLEKDINVNIQLLEFGGVDLEATIAFSKFYSDAKTQIVGIQFGYMDASLLSNLHQTLIKVDRIARGSKFD